MSSLDAMFLETEDGDRHSSMALASIAVLEGPVPDQDEIVRTIAGRLPFAARYRQKVLRVPFNLGEPVWVDDPRFDIAYHVRRTALPAPGDDADLCRLAARVMSQRLDRDRPLWEYWVIEGLAGGRWAILSKVHHCLVDGVGGNEPYRVLFDDSSTSAPPVPDSWQPRPVPSGLQLAAEAVGARARTQLAALEGLSRALLAPTTLRQRIGDTTLGLATLAGSFRPATRSSLVGPIGTSRRYGLARVPTADLVRVAKAWQVTVDDIVLAAVTGAFRRLLLGRGETPDPESIRTMVPVPVRPPHASGALANRVPMMLSLLPVDLADPVERLKAIHSRLAILKASKEAEAGDVLSALAGYEPSSVLSAWARAVAKFPQRGVVTVITNVPGPRTQLFIAGRALIEILPYIPIAGRMRFAVSVMIYRGQAVFGVTGDYDNAPEVDAFARSLTDGINGLLAALPRSPRSAVPAPRTAVPRSRGAIRGPTTAVR